MHPKAYNKNTVAVIILAAGLGTRMKSEKAKVLHEILGKPMIMYIAETAVKIGGDNVIIVVGNQADAVKKEVANHFQVLFSVQEEQLGTGHAVQCALSNVGDQIEQVVILNGDVPLLKPDTVRHLLDDHLSKKRDVTVMAVDVDNPKGYGRLVCGDNMHIFEIIEESDATAEQKTIRTINTGTYCVEKDFLFQSLNKIDSNNAQKEFYLTDIIKIGNDQGKAVGAYFGENAEEFIGINTPVELNTVENILKSRQGNRA